MLLFIDFCDCNPWLPWLISGLIGAGLGWLLGSRSGKKETVIEEKIVYKDKIVYQDKIVYKEVRTVEIGAGIAAKKIMAPKAPKPAIKKKTTKAVPKDKEDDYLSCKEYKGREINDKRHNVSMFKHDGDGQYYFAMYKADGSVKLRSEGFRTAKERDQELSGVLRFHDDESKYKTLTKGKYSMKVLYDETGREVGRSCLITSKEKVKKAAAATTTKAKPKAVAKSV
ncbi:MAG: hypothetical protein V3V00_02865, partial [Saprospiraceae bacterium]